MINAVNMPCHHNIVIISPPAKIAFLYFVSHVLYAMHSLLQVLWENCLFVTSIYDCWNSICICYYEMQCIVDYCILLSVLRDISVAFQHLMVHLKWSMSFCNNLIMMNIFSLINAAEQDGIRNASDGHVIYLHVSTFHRQMP